MVKTRKLLLIPIILLLFFIGAGLVSAVEPTRQANVIWYDEFNRADNTVVGPASDTVNWSETGETSAQWFNITDNQMLKWGGDNSDNFLCLARWHHNRNIYLSI